MQWGETTAAQDGPNAAAAPREDDKRRGAVVLAMVAALLIAGAAGATPVPRVKPPAKPSAVTAVDAPITLAPIPLAKPDRSRQAASHPVRRDRPQGVVRGVVPLFWAAEAAALKVAEPPIPPEWLIQPALAPESDLRVLSAADAARYAQIFTLQRDGMWRAADAAIAELDDRVLLGHLRYDRYMHPTRYRSSYPELRQWLIDYGDHPGAWRVYKLAQSRKPAGAKKPPAPTVGEATLAWLDGAAAAYHSARARSAREARAIARLQGDFAAAVGRGDLESAHRNLSERVLRDLLDLVEFDDLRSLVARGYYLKGRDEEALRLAEESARSRRHIPGADWTAGLAAWRLQDHERALFHFSALASNTRADAWSAAAGGFWGARAALVSGQPEQVSVLLARAAEHKETFYGLLAAKLLGMDLGRQWRNPPLTTADRQRLLSVPAIRRAVALAEAGEHERADEELRALKADPGSPLGEVVLEVATRLNLARTAILLSRLAERDGSAFADLAAFPVPHWAPAGGFTMDRAIVYAIIREESKFNVRATSPAGARGLMQLMPRTASLMAEDQSLRQNRDRIYSPEVNLALGQKYLALLLDEDFIAGDLFLLAAAYNGGPGNLRKWLDQVEYQDDPLLFIESIPSRETRAFIQRVMATFWIYRMRLGEETPSLDAIAANHWPTYLPTADAARKLADRGLNLD
ncbi:MAG: lytic transglycosylase domain-containing protein [Alphaproteobacteria bacterium]|nr:lytic transglycosylase domain-containing protein [Alphaproteobacteria bacterium]